MAVQNHMDPICHVCSECLETPFVRMLQFPSFRKPDIKLPDSPEKAQFFLYAPIKNSLHWPPQGFADHMEASNLRPKENAYKNVKLCGDVEAI